VIMNSKMTAADRESLQGQPLIELQANKESKDSDMSQELLQLNATLNFFVGGDVFTRGVTLDHLICVLYARRSTKTTDTIVQHARWYGARSLKDKAVTRIYMPSQVRRRHRAAYELNRSIAHQVRAAGGRLEVIAEPPYTSLNYTSNSHLHRPTTDQLTARRYYYPHPSEISPVHGNRLKKLIESLDELIQAQGLALNRRGDALFGEPEVSQLFELIDECYEMDRADKDAWHHEVVKSMILIGTEHWSQSLKVTFVPNLTINASAYRIIDDQQGIISTLQSESRRSSQPRLLLARAKPEWWKSTQPLYWPYLINPRRVLSYTFHHSDARGDEQ